MLVILYLSLLVLLLPGVVPIIRCPPNNAAEMVAEKLDKKLRLLIEINIGGEEAKTGFAPDAEELIQLLGRRKEMKHIEIRGLMAVPPFTDAPEGARKYFRELRKLRDELAARMNMNLPELSMGMSHDYEVAVEEGSTCVRIGTAIFGARDYSK